MALVEALCISRKKGTVKKSVSRAEFLPDWGIVGDAHAGQGHRQVSLLSGESVDGVRQQIPQLRPGAFAENVVTRGFRLADVRIGDRIRLGESVVLEVTQIGKECHTACAIKRLTGDCIMPREGIFARVVRGGTVRPGDPVEICSALEAGKAGPVAAQTFSARAGETGRNRAG